MPAPAIRLPIGTIVTARDSWSRMVPLPRLRAPGQQQAQAALPEAAGGDAAGYRRRLRLRAPGNKKPFGSRAKSCKSCCPPSSRTGSTRSPRAYKGRREAAHCRSLISHSRPAVSVSCAAGLGGLCSWSKKYAPLTFATSGEVASHTRVSAPFSGLRASGLRIVIPKPISRPLLRLNPVATSPGWKQFAVTPVPSRRRASSVVNRMLASLVSQ